jgi:hypothetical protein
VKKDFSLADIDYLSTIVCSVVIGYQFFVIAINCVARIFNMMLLYLVAPLFIGASPLDDGAKMKQWGVAFTVQSLSVIGSIIIVRLLLVFIPVISSNTLVLFPDSAILDFFARVIFLVALACTASKATGMIGGILSDSAGWQAISAGDVGSGAPSSAMQGVNSVLSVGKAVNSIGKSASSLIGKAVGWKKGEVPKNKSDSSSEKDKSISEKSENASNFQSQNSLGKGKDGQGKEVKGDNNPQEGNKKEPENKNKAIDGKDGINSPQNNIVGDNAENKRVDENARQPENRAPEHVLNYTPGRKTRRRPPKSRGKWKDL